MGRALEIISGKATNPSTTFTALTMATGDSATVRNFQDSDMAFMEDMWAQGATAGAVRVTSPRLHDNLQGIRLGYAAATPQPLTPPDLKQRLRPQDNLTLQITGGGGEVDVASFLNVYNNLPGVDANLQTWEQVKPQIRNIAGVQTDHTIGATAGDYSGQQTIVSLYDTLKANEHYAILGYLVSAAVCSIGFRSPDFGNLRVGGPGTIQRLETRSWFKDLALRNGEPFIPVFNAANKFSTFVDLFSTATAGAVSVWTILAELG